MDGIIVTDIGGRLRFRFANGQIRIAEGCSLAKRLSNIEGVIHSRFNDLTNGLLVLYQPGEQTRLSIIKTLASLTPRAVKSNSKGKRENSENLPVNPIWSHLVKKMLPLPVRYGVSFLQSMPHLLSGLCELCKGRLNVEVLDASALLICFLRRDFRAAGTLLFFFSLGHFLEMWTKKRSKAGLYKSLAGKVEKVWIKNQDGGEFLVSEAELSEGDLVIARAGGLIPVDGLVIEGEAMINQSSMTGEALAVPRSCGGAVFAGTTVEQGEIIIRATKVGGATRVQSIVRYIEESEASKAGVQGRAERLADSIVPFSFILSGLVFLFTRNLLKAANVLLVDYSCAIRLATPLTVLSAMREGNERGVLVKGGRFLEELANANTIVFDKTGTLTEAKPEVASIITFADMNEDEALRLAACLEEHFPHPVGRAVVKMARLKNLQHEEEHTKVDYVVAHGISSTWHGKKVVLGSRHFVIDDEKVIIGKQENTAAESEAALGRSILYLAVDGRLTALISIKDKLRPGVKNLLSDLKDMGLKRSIMLTGDIESTAAALARKIGFEEYESHMLPDDKSTFIENLKHDGRKVIMVGDGLNDSAALSRADVGVSMADSSALAKDVANVLLLGDKIDDLKTARTLAAKSMSRIKSNYWIIVGCNSAFLGLGLFGLAGPALISLLHNATTALVAYRSTLPLLAAKPSVHYKADFDNMKGST